MNKAIAGHLHLIDVFYVLDSRGEKFMDVEFQQEVTQGVLYSIGQFEN